MPTDRALAELALRMHGELFVGRRDDFIIRPSNTFPRRAKRPLQPKDIEAHLEGRYGVGPYILSPEMLGGAGCRYGVLDVDADEPEAVRVAWSWLRERSFTALVETSKSKGFHLWLLAEDLVPAADVRRILGNCAEAVRAAVPAVAARQGNARKDGLVEVFPKHAALAARVLYSGGVQLPLNGSVVGAGRTVLLNPESMSPYLDQAAAMHGAVLHRHPAGKISEAAAALPVWPVPVEKPRASRRHKDGALYNDAFERVKAATDLLALVQEATGQDGRRTGPEVAFLCPLHEERDASFMVNPADGVFHCWGCGAAGSAIDFWSKAKGTTIGEALRDLAGRADVELKERRGNHAKNARKKEADAGIAGQSMACGDAVRDTVVGRTTVSDRTDDAPRSGTPDDVQTGGREDVRGSERSGCGRVVDGDAGRSRDYDLDGQQRKQAERRGGNAGDPAARGCPGGGGPGRETVGDSRNPASAEDGSGGHARRGVHGRAAGVDGGAERSGRENRGTQNGTRDLPREERDDRDDGVGGRPEPGDGAGAIDCAEHRASEKGPDPVAGDRAADGAVQLADRPARRYDGPAGRVDGDGRGAASDVGQGEERTGRSGEDGPDVASEGEHAGSEAGTDGEAAGRTGGGIAGDRTIRCGAGDAQSGEEAGRPREPFQFGGQRTGAVAAAGEGGRSGAGRDGKDGRPQGEPGQLGRGNGPPVRSATMDKGGDGVGTGEKSGRGNSRPADGGGGAEERATAAEEGGARNEQNGGRFRQNHEKSKGAATAACRSKGRDSGTRQLGGTSGADAQTAYGSRSEAGTTRTRPQDEPGGGRERNRPPRGNAAGDEGNGGGGAGGEFNDPESVEQAAMRDAGQRGGRVAKDGAGSSEDDKDSVDAPPPGHPAADPGPDEEQPPDGAHPNLPRRPTEDIILEFIRSPEGPRFTFRRKKEAYSERDGRWYSAMDWKQSYDRRVLKQILRESLDVPPGEVRLKVARSVWNLWTVRAFNIEYATLKEQGDMKGVTAGEYADLEKAVRTALTRDLRVAESTSDRIVLRSVISYALGRDHGGWVQVGRSGAWCRPGPRVALEYRFLAAYGGNAMGQFSRKTFARKLREAKIGESGSPPVSGVRMYVIFDDWLRENLDVDVREAVDAPEPAVDDVKKRAAGDVEDDDD